MFSLPPAPTPTQVLTLSPPSPRLYAYQIRVCSSIKVPDEVLNQDPDVHVDDSEIRAQLEKELEEDLAVTWKEVRDADEPKAAAIGGQTPTYPSLTRHRRSATRVAPILLASGASSHFTWWASPEVRAEQRLGRHRTLVLTHLRAALYFFLFSLDLMGTAAKIMGGCTAGTLLGDINNPIAGLTIGILATVLLQSSSTTTSIIVSLVGSDTIEVKLAIYIIMGANIGTSVTNTIVAMGQMGDKDQLERVSLLARARSASHSLYNY